MTEYYIDYANSIFELIINIAIFIGILILAFFYRKLNRIEREIEKILTSSEKEREIIKKQGETMRFVNGNLDNEKRKTQEQISPLKRERYRILSKIPFLK